MSSNRQTKNRTTKAKDATSRTRVKESLGNTLINSRSMTKIQNPQKGSKNIPKILSRIEKNVHDLKKYCSDLTPNTSRKNDRKKEAPGQPSRTVNDPCQETTASVDDIKKEYLSVYGKQTENIIELWKFYNSSIHRGNKRTSLTAYSASIPIKSQIGPDYSLESRCNDSGVHSAMSSIRVPLESINLSDLMTNSNRPSDRRARPQILQNVIYQEEEQCRPLQRMKYQPQKQVKSINFNLHSELDLSIPSKKAEISKDKSTLEEYRDLSFKEMNEANRQKESSSKLEHKDPPVKSLSAIIEPSVQLKEQTSKSRERVAQVQPEKEWSIVREIREEEAVIAKLSFDQPQPIAIPIKQEEKVVSQTIFDQDESNRIFQKNMLINKRKQELNAKLKKGGKSGCEDRMQNDVPVIEFGLDQAIIIQQERPMFANELPLSKQDISLLQKLDQIDKDMALMQQQNVENCVFQALKDLKRKKRFQKSKFTVAEIPIRKTKKPMVVDLIEDENIDFNEIEKCPKVKKTTQKEKEKSNSSLLDCEIQGIEGEDSLLQNFQAIEIDL